MLIPTARLAATPVNGLLAAALAAYRWRAGVPAADGVPSRNLLQYNGQQLLLCAPLLGWSIHVGIVEIRSGEIDPWYECKENKRTKRTRRDVNFV